MKRKPLPDLWDSIGIRTAKAWKSICNITIWLVMVICLFFLLFFCFYYHHYHYHLPIIHYFYFHFLHYFRGGVLVPSICKYGIKDTILIACNKSLELMMFSLFLCCCFPIRFPYLAHADLDLIMQAWLASIFLSTCLSFQCSEITLNATMPFLESVITHVKYSL